MKYAGWLQSSTDPETVSNTVRGSVLAVSGLIIFFAAQLFNITLTAGDVLSLATQLGTLAGLLWAAYGLIMKFVVWLGTVRHAVPAAPPAGRNN